MSNELKREGRSALIYAATTFLIRGGSLLAIPLFWSKLTPVDYGIIASAEIIARLFTTYANLGIEQSINKRYYVWQEQQRRKGIGTLWLTAWVSILITGLPTYFLLIYAANYIFPNIEISLIQLGFWAAFVSAFHIVPYNVLRIKGKVISYSIYAIFQFLIGIFFSIYSFCYR